MREGNADTVLKLFQEAEKSGSTAEANGISALVLGTSAMLLSQIYDRLSMDITTALLVSMEFREKYAAELVEYVTGRGTEYIGKISAVPDGILEDAELVAKALKEGKTVRVPFFSRRLVVSSETDDESR